MGAGTAIRRVLLPTDFSEASSHALDQALAIAGAWHARITGLHVGDGADELKKWLACGDRSEVACDAVTDSGDPASVILRYATILPADLIVLGTHGASGFEHLVIGSVTEKVLRKASCPVLTVPPRAKSTSRIPFERMICAVDFSEWSTEALQVASSLVSKTTAALTLVHVIEWPWPEPPPPTFSELPSEQGRALAEYRRYLESSATKRLQAAAERLKLAADIEVCHGKPYVEILRLAAERQADVIVLGVHGRNPVDVTLFGSTTNQIVRHASCPVLTLRH